MRYPGDEITIDRTYNPKCPSCIDKIIHTVRNWKEYHPHAGEGYSKEHGSPRPKEVSKVSDGSNSL